MSMKRILNSFVLATGLGAICVDAQGELAIVPEEHEGYCPFCKEIRRDQEGRKRCNESMNKAGKLAAQLGEPCIYRCHAGLIEFAVKYLNMVCHDMSIHICSVRSGLNALAFPK
jgi:ligand-binding sensor protein